MSNKIEFKNITKEFPGTIALDNVSFTIKTGEIHAIVGANGAGKSTLMNILGGQLKPDKGAFFIDGKQHVFYSPQESRDAGISVVHQELKLCENLNVAQNIFLGNEIKTKLGAPDSKTMVLKAQEALESLNADIDPKTKLSKLSIGKKQMIEISKALYMNASIVIFDEPTSSLSTKDAEKLFKNMIKMKKQGITLLFISHRMEEVFRISDRITVMRDGKYMGTFDRDKTEPEKIVDLIAGKQLSEELAAGHSKAKINNDPILVVKNLTRGNLVRKVSFNLNKGEILGIYGLQGAGRTELLETLFGLEKKDSGEVDFLGKETHFKSPKDAIEVGIAMISEDRRGKGIFSNFSIEENISVVNPEGIHKTGFLKQSVVSKYASDAVKKIGIKATGIKQKIASLSGGNQQKVIIARWLSKEPKLLLLDEVSRGIDVGSKAEIFKTIRSFKNKGMSIIFVSSEIEEIVAECDRTLIMWNGEIVAEYSSEEMSGQQMVRSAMGY